MVRNGWNTTREQAIEHACVLNTNRHGMAGEPFGIGDHQFVGGVSKCIPQGFDFGLSRATAGWSVGFMGKEDRLRSNFVTVDAPSLFHVTDKAIHDLTYVLNVKTCPVIC